MNINLLQNRLVIFIGIGLVLISIYFYLQKPKEKVIELYNFKTIYNENFQVKLTDGLEKENVFIVDKVIDEASVDKGLMYINSMSPQNGLLFEFSPAEEVSFWMKNTYIPLDIIFINEENIVTNIAKNAKILDTSLNYASVGKAKYVLEINAGLADRLSIIEGDKLILEKYAE